MRCFCLSSSWALLHKLYFLWICVFWKTKVSLYFSRCACVPACLCVCACVHTCGDEITPCWSQCFPSALSVLGTELRFSGLASSVYHLSHLPTPWIYSFSNINGSPDSLATMLVIGFANRETDGLEYPVQCVCTEPPCMVSQSLSSYELCSMI